MAQKEYHHYQFIDPSSGEMPFSVTMLVRYHKKRVKDPDLICADDLILLDQELDHFDGDFKKLLNK